MYNITDSVVLALTLYFFYRGASRGLLRTLLGPVSLVLGAIIAMIHYAYYHELIMSLVISIIAPFIINILFSLVLTLWNKGVNAGQSISLTSRLLGATLSILWGTANVLLIIILIALVPVSTAALENLRQDIFKSKTYSLVDQWTKNLIPQKSFDMRAISQVMQNPDQLENLQESAEFKAVSEDTSIQQLLSDKQIAQDIEEKDFAGLMSNPKIQGIMENPELIKKILNLNMKIMEGGQGPSTAQKSAGPKTIEIKDGKATDISPRATGPRIIEIKDQ